MFGDVIVAKGWVIQFKKIRFHFNHKSLQDPLKNGPWNSQDQSTPHPKVRSIFQFSPIILRNGRKRRLYSEKQKYEQWISYLKILLLILGYLEKLFLTKKLSLHISQYRKLPKTISLSTRNRLHITHGIMGRWSRQIRFWGELWQRRYNYTIMIGQRDVQKTYGLIGQHGGVLLVFPHMSQYMGNKFFFPYNFKSQLSKWQQN